MLQKPRKWQRESGPNDMGHPVHTPRCSLKDIKVAFIVEQKLKPPIGLYYFEDLSCNVTHYSHVGPLLENVRLSARECASSVRIVPNV